MKRKILNMLLALITTTCVLTLPACWGAADDDNDSADSTDNSSPTKGLAYELSADKSYYIVSGIGSATTENIIVPSQYNNLPVKEIGEDAFYKCETLTSITLPDSITVLGEEAFESCINLLNITMSKNLITISDDAFAGCMNLTSITIPKNVTYIGDGAFYYCFKLVEVYNLSSIVIEKGSAENGYAGCFALGLYTSEDEESKLHFVDNNIFYVNYDNIYFIGQTNYSENVTLPDSYNGKNYAINKYAYYGRTIKTITIPNSVTLISYYAFYDSTTLTSVTFENTSGWTYSSSETDTNGTSISSSDLSNTSTAARYLTKTYSQYYWHRAN